VFGEDGLGIEDAWRGTGLLGFPAGVGPDTTRRERRERKVRKTRETREKKEDAKESVGGGKDKTSGGDAKEC
jgi:hypothetical protein